MRESERWVRGPLIGATRPRPSWLHQVGTDAPSGVGLGGSFVPSAAAARITAMTLLSAVGEVLCVYIMTRETF